ncbi:hypothetical protein I6A60_19750 [Frankia sp. AgB1.9]|uniref:hypothetical protein n=1 Tax=unclassified Frankia TaxID=2632575 RepID=UPI0019341550|nr:MULTISPECIES: hypothetical protein [unclassified Frankia]MBL7491503.1 hypothetical protein [Frankia sp. AgW1.1]MBL7550097.1 hypothetical protein [Frankia sp. AgB1.9]MBL7621159.1 hypothetical protein [Frankia sp. AgB1.8]
MRVWKVLGLAGVVGVAATGAMVARAERARRSYTPDEIRERLHSRLAGDAQPAPDGTAATASAEDARRARPDAS